MTRARMQASAALAVSLALINAGSALAASPAPMSDPQNKGGWQLNAEISDEFDGDSIDHDKWNVQGLNGGYNGWKGRAPSQFVPENVLVEDGLLKIRSKWEPDYDFVEEDLGGVQYGDPIAPVTTGAIIGNRRFLHGYMEVRSKAADAAMTSAFWALGHQSELDMYEQMGRPKKGDGGIEADTLNAAIHDWRPGKFVGNGAPLNKVYNMKHELGFRVADDFHVYGVEWDPDFLRFFVDGQLVRESSREEIGEGWVLTNPLQLYFDSEIFSWLGYPHPEELPADYEVDYVRVWQKPTDELLDRAFFGFEGPLFTYGQKPAGDGVVKVRNKQEWQQNWYLDPVASQYFSIGEHPHFRDGKQSLKLNRQGPLAGSSVTAFSPPGSVQLAPGKYMLSIQVFVPAEADATIVQMILDDPWYQSPEIDLGRLPRDRWINLAFPVERKTASGESDRIRIVVLDTGKAGAGTYYFDAVSLKPQK